MKKIKRIVRILLTLSSISKLKRIVRDKLDFIIKSRIIYTVWLDVVRFQLAELLKKMALYEVEQNLDVKGLSAVNIEAIEQKSLNKNEVYQMKDYLIGALTESAAHFYLPLKELAFIFSSKPSQPDIEPVRKPVIGTSPGKIVFVTGVFPSVNHGGGLRIFDLIHELSLLGYEVALFTVKPLTDADSESLIELKKYLKRLELVDVCDFHVSFFNEWLETDGVIYDSGYFVWTVSANLLLNSKKLY
jgi:hypothetical protein